MAVVESAADQFGLTLVCVTVRGENRVVMASLYASPPPLQCQAHKMY